jgi:TonB family protein
MGRRRVFGIVLLSFVLMPLGMAQDIVGIRVWLFKGIVLEGEAAPEKVEILSSLTNPELSGLRSRIGGSEEEFKEGLINALLEIKNLRTLDDLWLFKSAWEEARPKLGSAIIKNKLAFRVDLYRIYLSPSQLTFRAVISKSREGAVREFKSEKLSAQDAYLATRDESKMEKIVDQELQVTIGEPTVVGVPYKDGVYYMTVLTTPVDKGFDVSPKTKVEHPREAKLFEAPQPAHTVLPVYPEDLRQKDVKGDVGLRVTIDKKGNVEGVDVRRPVHPYLDYSAVRAVLQWEFEPILQKNEPVRAAFDYTIRFDPQDYREELVPAVEVLPEELKRIIDGCTAYSRKLIEMGPFFTCEESIKETHYRLKPEISRWEMTSYKYKEVLWDDGKGGGVTQTTAIGIMDPGRTEINRYICDYQLTKKDGQEEERRILLKENGRKISDWTKLLEEKRFSVLNPFLGIFRILGPNRRSGFTFQLAGEEKIRGKKAYIIEALPSPGAEGVVLSAKFWSDKETFQILRSEIRGVPLEGYYDVLTDSATLNVMPEFKTTYEYKAEKNGVLYPERTTVAVEYPHSGRKILKYKSELTYSKFKFFTVETQHKIIK